MTARQNQCKALVLALLLACGAEAACTRGAARPTVLTVSAAISLKEPLEEIARLYQQQGGSVRITGNFGASGSLQHQIEQGAPADIFISAAEKPMDTLESEGLLVAGTRRDLLTNSLVLIVPAGAGPPRAASFEDLRRPQVKVVALGEPAAVPAGMYAQELLEHLRLWDAVQKKAVYAGNVRQVLAFVETGNADAGIVYRTDARNSTKVRIVAGAPAGSYSPVIYPAAVLKNSHAPAAARAFVEFLASPPAQAVFEKYGFGIAGQSR
jgi:molybdate transport system substrate-binding protein